jgi:hypothetical protein
MLRLQGAEIPGVESFNGLRHPHLPARRHGAARVLGSEAVRFA